MFFWGGEWPDCPRPLGSASDVLHAHLWAIAGKHQYFINGIVNYSEVGTSRGPISGRPSAPSARPSTWRRGGGAAKGLRRFVNTPRKINEPPGAPGIWTPRDVQAATSVREAENHLLRGLQWLLEIVSTTAPFVLCYIYACVLRENCPFHNLYHKYIKKNMHKASTGSCKMLIAHRQTISVLNILTNAICSSSHHMHVTISFLTLSQAVFLFCCFKLFILQLINGNNSQPLQDAGMKIGTHNHLRMFECQASFKLLELKMHKL